MRARAVTMLVKIGPLEKNKLKKKLNSMRMLHVKKTKFNSARKLKR
jgi:hypothetical protein